MLQLTSCPPTTLLAPSRPHPRLPQPGGEGGERGRGGRGGGGHAGEACKPLLSVCSRVICQLSCSARQSLGEIAAYSAASSFSLLSWTWARTLGGPLLSLLLDSGLSSFFFLLPFCLQKGKMFKFNFIGSPKTYRGSKRSFSHVHSSISKKKVKKNTHYIDIEQYNRCNSIGQ